MTRVSSSRPPGGQPPEPTPDPQLPGPNPLDSVPKEVLVRMLGELFITSEAFIAEMRNKETFHSLSNDFANTMINTRALLRVLKCEPICNRSKEPLTYSRDV